MATPRVCFRNRRPPHPKLAEAFPLTLSYSFQHMMPGLANFSLPLTGPGAIFPDSTGGLGKGAMVSIERDDGYLTWVGFVTRVSIDKASNSVAYNCKDHAGALFARAASLRGQSMSGTAGDLLVSIFREADSRAAPPLLCEYVATGGGWIDSFSPRNGKLLDVLGQLAQAACWEWALRYTVAGTVRSRLLFQQRVGTDYSGKVAWHDGIHMESLVYTQDLDGDLEAAIAVGGSGAYTDRLAVMTSRSGAGGAGVSEVRRLHGSSGGGALLMGSGLGGTAVVLDPQVEGSEALAAAGAYALERPPDALGDQLSFNLVESEIDLASLGVGNWYTVQSPDIALGGSLSRLVRVMALQLSSDGKVETEVQVVA